MFHKKTLILLFIFLILSCCIFQSCFPVFYKPVESEQEGFENINPTSLGNYQIPAKYVLLDLSRNTSLNKIDNICFYVFSNGHSERLDLSQIATASFIDKNLEDVIKDTTQTIQNNESENETTSEELNEKNEENMSVSKILEDNNKDSLTIEGDKKKILITFPRQYIKLPSIDRIIMTSTDEMFQDTVFACKFYDENLSLISTVNMEITYQENLTIPYKKFVYYNQTYYRDNKLPREYNFNAEYTKNNTYFKTFLFENKELSSKVESNSDKNLDELQAYYHSNDKNFGSLKSYYSKLNEEENIVSPLYGLSPQLDSDVYTNNQDLSQIMKSLENSNTETNYRSMFNNVGNNLQLNTSSGVQYFNGSYIDNDASNDKSLGSNQQLDHYRGEKIQFNKKMNYMDYNNTSRASNMTSNMN